MSTAFRSVGCTPHGVAVFDIPKPYLGVHLQGLFNINDIKDRFCLFACIAGGVLVEDDATQGRVIVLAPTKYI